MKLSVTCRGAALVWMVVMSLGPLAGSTQGCLFPWGCQSAWGGYGYGAGYGYGYYGMPVYYSAGYGYAATYGTSYGACGLSGCSGCAAPACLGYTPGCNATSGCGVGCQPCCGATYGCCGNGLCDSSGCCSAGGGNSDSAGGAAPYSAEPTPDSRSSSPSTPSGPPRTYRDDGLRNQDDRFKEPRVVPQGGTAPSIFPDENGTSGTLPLQSEPSTDRTPDSEIERGNGFQFDLKIPGDQSPPPGDEQSMDDSVVVEPLDIDTQVAYRAHPERRRSSYRAVFKTPAVARRDIARGSQWTSIDEAAQLAASH